LQWHRTKWHSYKTQLHKALWHQHFDTLSINTHGITTNSIMTISKETHYTMNKILVFFYTRDAFQCGKSVVKASVIVAKVVAPMSQQMAKDLINKQLAIREHHWDCSTHVERAIIHCQGLVSTRLFYMGLKTAPWHSAWLQSVQH